MTDVRANYVETTTDHAGKILSFLRIFEALQQEIHLSKIEAHQKDLVGKVGDLFATINEQNENLEVPSERNTFHSKWTEALEHLEDA